MCMTWSIPSADINWHMGVIFPSQLQGRLKAFLIWPVGNDSELYSFCFNSTQAAVYCFALSLVKTPSLIVIKFALVSCLIFFPALASSHLCGATGSFSFCAGVIPHCHSFAPRHRPLPRAPVQQQVTRGRGSPVIGGCQLPSLATDMLLPWQLCKTAKRPWLFWGEHLSPTLIHIFFWIGLTFLYRVHFFFIRALTFTIRSHIQHL